MTDPSQQPDADEQQLLDDLARVVQARDPVPPDAVAMAQELFTWRTVDAELAELVADSAEESTAALVRGGATDVRLLAFAAARGITLDVEVLAEGDARRLVGELSPGGAARITVEHPAGSVTEDTDELGRFLVTGVPAGWLRIRCAPGGGPAFLTPWLRL